MIETLTCPHCKFVIKSDKAVGLPDTKTAGCPQCKKGFTLGQARQKVAVSDPRKPSPPPVPRPAVPAVVEAEVVDALPTGPHAIAQKQESPLSRFAADGQSTAMITKLVARVGEICTSEEEVLYMAVQQKPVANVSPDAIVLTSRRVIIFRQKLLGRMEFHDLLWMHVGDVHMKEDLLGATVTVTATNGGSAAVDHIPKAQARKVYRIAQEQEERMMEYRRQRAMEEDRNRAGQVVVQNAIAATPAAAPPAADDPVAVLSKLKSMLDAGLITQAEFDSKKADLLSRM